jgi:hypothetical protein
VLGLFAGAREVCCTKAGVNSELATSLQLGSHNLYVLRLGVLHPELKLLGGDDEPVVRSARCLEEDLASRKQDGGGGH